MKLEAVLFDLDGTLIDTAPDFFRVLNHMLEEDGRAPLNYSDVRKTVSDGARALVKLAYGVDQGEAGFDELRQRLLDLYLNNIAIDSQLFAGLDDMLNWMLEHNLPMAIVTNKPRLYAETLLNQLNFNGGPLAQITASLVCPDDVTHRKPHPEPLFKACNEMEVDAKRCIYVGDHARDIESGRAAGMTTIAAAFGYIHSAEDVEQWHADWRVDNSQDLLPLLKTLSTSE